MSEHIWQWTATRTAEAIRTGTISSREATESVLERIDEVNPHINALAEVSHDEALAAADAADRQQAAGHLSGPLHGVPVTIKINSDQAGHATTNGITAFKNALVEHDAPHVANWRNAGAIFVGRTNTPAFSIRWFTDNDLHGRTLNPWDRERTPGGSSGGAAAAVATGMGALAHGNDIGGSIRYPAASCGVVGIRPTVGRVPSWYGPRDQDQLLGVQNMLVQGPLARTVADARLGLTAMARWSPEDPFCIPVPLTAEPLPRPTRVAVVREVGITATDPAVDAAVTKAAKALEAAGHLVEEVELPVLADAWKLWWQLVQGIEFSELAPSIEQYGDSAIQRSAENQFAVARRMSDDFGLEAYMRGYARRGTLIREMQIFLQEYPLVLTPVSAERTFEVDADVQGVDRMQEVINAQWPMMSLAALGFPALSVPAAAPDGLPIGVQIIGQKFREDMLFGAGEIIEAQSNVTTPVRV